MDRLFFSSYLLFLISCIHHQCRLVSFVQADDGAVLYCDNETQSLKCANLGNIIYRPLIGDAHHEPYCAPESFKLNCSSTTPADWIAFKDALSTDVQHKLGAPALTGIFQVGHLSFVNLTWDIDFWANSTACDAQLANTVNKFIPEVTNLTAFQVSSDNHILLMNCSRLPSSLPQYLQISNTTCLAYQERCAGGILKSTPCAQMAVPTKELKLHQALESFSCTHFQLLVSANDDTPITSWTPGLVELFYGDSQCEACYHTGGSCVFTYNAPIPTFQECNCGKNKSSNTDCLHIPSSSCRGSKCNTGAKIAVEVALIIVVATVTVIIVATVIVNTLGFWVYYRKTGYSTKSFTNSSSNRLFTQRAYMLSKKFGPVSTKEFSFESLSKATKSFADENLIGDGGFGAVYVGILEDGHKVAIKRLYHDNFRRMDHFYNEIKILSNLSHPNLVKLYGFCCQDSRDLLLVFEFASNGTVSDQLHDATKPAMPWRTRLNIARETAEALSYLHNLVNPPIYHRDVKTTNILLDDDLHAILADFGLSRLVPLQATHVSTDPQGTPGYLDPDYHQCYQLTDKSDVYSFGVVLMELVSAKLAVDMSRDRREINLSNLALMKIGCGQWEDLVDPRLEIKKNPDVKKMVKRVVELAFICLDAEKDSRPTMKCIAETLASMCKEFGYGHDDDANGRISFKVHISAPSSADETSHLIKAKSSSKSTLSADSPPSYADWTSSNASSYVKSF